MKQEFNSKIAVLDEGLFLMQRNRALNEVHSVALAFGAKLDHISFAGDCRHYDLPNGNRMNCIYSVSISQFDGCKDAVYIEVIEGPETPDPGILFAEKAEDFASICAIVSEAIQA